MKVLEKLKTKDLLALSNLQNYVKGVRRPVKTKHYYIEYLKLKSLSRFVVCSLIIKYYLYSISKTFSHVSILSVLYII